MQIKNKKYFNFVKIVLWDDIWSTGLQSIRWI